jgi:preprotein translocase subunit SecA
MPLLHHVNQALRAHALFHRDVDYMVKDGEVVIVDEFTGRLMPGRPLERRPAPGGRGKEKVKIERENQTLATVTFQNYFRKYKKLAGMTGTPTPKPKEFNKIYKLDVVVIPPNRPLRRVENPDLVYRTEKEKWDAIVTEIIDEHAKGRPSWSARFRSRSRRSSRDARPPRAEARHHDRRRRDKHVVLNAKYHAQEAEFVAQAGRKGAVTIATNMAGRGTDILLGGNPSSWRASSAWRKRSRAAAQGRRALRRGRAVRLLLPPRCLLSRAEGRLLCGSSSTSSAVRPEHDEWSGLDGLHIVATERKRRGASTTSCAAAPAARAIPALPLLPVARRRSDAHLRLGSHLRPDAEARDGRGRARSSTAW